MQEKYYHTKESVKEYIKAAEGYNGNNLIEKLVHFLPKGATLLEFGSGPGKDWKTLSEYYKVTGSDFSEEFLTHLRTQNPKETFLKIDASEINTDKTFDGIFSNKVLHHLSNEQLKQSIARQSEILTPNGIICHSFWKGKGDEEFKGMYVNYHEKNGLQKVFEDHFDILVLELYKEFEENDSILIIALKK